MANRSIEEDANMELERGTSGVFTTHDEQGNNSDLEDMEAEDIDYSSDNDDVFDEEDEEDINESLRNSLKIRRRPSSNRNNNQNNNQNNEQKRSFIQEHGDALLALAAGYFGAKFLNKNNNSNSNTNQSSDTNSSGGSRGAGFGGTLLMMIACFMMIVLIIMTSVITVKMYGAKTPEEGLGYLMGVLTGKTSKGTDFIDPYVQDETPEMYKDKKVIPLPYRKLDNETIAVNIDDYLTVSLNRKSKSEEGFILIYLEKDNRTNQVLFYREATEEEIKSFRENNKDTLEKTKIGEKGITEENKGAIESIADFFKNIFN